MFEAEIQSQKQVFKAKQNLKIKPQKVTPSFKKNRELFFMENLSKQQTQSNQPFKIKINPQTVSDSACLSASHSARQLLRQPVNQSAS